MFLFILGARLWLIGKYGTDLPFWDQWSEGYGLFKKISDGTVTIQDWLAPNSEHRILLTRLFSYGLFAINGQWDSRVQMVANAAFFSAFGCLLFLLFAKAEKRLFGLFSSIILALIFACPFGWQNTLWGFQSHFYFLIVFSLATIWLMINKPAWSLGWLFGVLCGICTLFTLASGLLASLAVFCFMCVVLVRDWQIRREALQRLWPSAVISIAIIATGALFFVRVEGHNNFRADSVATFFNALSCYLAWPWLPSGWPWNFAEAIQPESLTWPWYYKEWCWFWAIVSWFPATVLLCRYLTKRLPDGRNERFIVAVIVWMFLTILAMAFFRSSGSAPPRYFDLLSIGLIFNAISAWILIHDLPASKKKYALSALLVAWLALNGLGMYRLGFVTMIGASTGTSIQHRGYLHEVQKFKLSGYIVTHDMQLITPQKSRFEIPYPGKEGMVQLLSDPFILRILPVSVRKPLRVSNADAPPFSIDPRYMLGSSAPYPWDKLWPLPAPGNSDYSVTKTQGLPYLHMFVRGDIDKIKIVDANTKQHDLVTLTQGPNGWYEVYGSCPTTQCSIRSVDPAQNPTVFSEPKELGRLSLVATLLTNRWWLFCVAGGVIFLSLIIKHFFSVRNERPLTIVEACADPEAS